MNEERDNTESSLAEANLPATVSYDIELPLAKTQRYEPKRFHARGGMGDVWLAFDPLIGREVALKRIRAKHSDQELRFMAEAQIAGQLEHPSIVPVHDLGKGEDGLPFYVMKFVHGKTFKEVIQEFHAQRRTGKPGWPVRWRQLLDVFVDLCEAVAYAHSRGVIHRDLKPDNVMVGSFGETMVIDWGLAKLLHQPEAPGTPTYMAVTSSGDSAETHAGSVIGSPPYMPPEMAEGHADEAGPATDVYLLGATLYSMLTNAPPRRGASHAEIVELARTVPPVPPRQHHPWVPRALEAICLRAMEMRIEDRYASAMELASDVRCFLAGEPVQAYPEGIAARSVRYAKRHWRGVLAVAATCLILALVLFSSLLRLRELARDDLASFHKLADEARYWMANTNPSGEAAPYYDTEQGEQVARGALQVNQRWATWLDRLPLVEVQERDLVNSEVHELLLLLVRSRMPNARNTEEQRELLDLLEQAKQLAPPSRAVFRMEAELHAKLANATEAERARNLARDPQIPKSALDHFLQGEKFRAESTRTAASDSMANPDSLDEDSQDETRASLQAAVREYESALEIDPDHFWCRFQLGRCYLALGQNPQALAALRACVALRPISPWGRSTFGFALNLSGQAAAAIKELDRVVESDASFLPARLNRAVAYWLQKDAASALKDLEVVLQAPPDKRLLEATYYRAQIRMATGDLPGALTDLDDLIKGKRNFLPAYLASAEAQFLAGNDKQGLADVDRFLALQATPESELAYRRGWLLRRIAEKKIKPVKVKQRVLELARLELQQAAQLLDTPNAHAELAEVLRRQGKYDEAIASCSKGLQQSQDDLRLLRIRAQVYVNKRQQNLAADDFRRAATNRPTTADEIVKVADCHARLGHILATQKNRNEAESQAAHAFAVLQPGNADHYILQHNLACIYGELANWDAKDCADHQCTALRLIEGALRVAQHTNAKAKAREIQFIKVEPAFNSLRGLPDFQLLLTN